MKKSLVTLFLAVFVLQGLSACASREEAKNDNETTPAIMDNEDQLAGVESELKKDVPQPLPVSGSAAELPVIKGEPSLTSELTPPKAAKPAKKETPKTSVEKAATVSDKGAFKTTVKACPMKSKADLKSSTLTTVPKGRKLWAEKSGSFYKVSRVKGVGYLPKSCF